MISDRCNKILIKPKILLSKALKQIDKTALQVLVVIDEYEKLFEA